MRGFEVQLRGTVEWVDGRYHVRVPSPAPRFAIRGDLLTGKLAALVGKEVRARGRLVLARAPLELELTEVVPH